MTVSTYASCEKPASVCDHSAACRAYHTQEGYLVSIFHGFFNLLICVKKSNKICMIVNF